MTTLKALTEQLNEKRKVIESSGHPKYHEKLKQQNKLLVRDRLALLFDDCYTFRAPKGTDSSL